MSKVCIPPWPAFAPVEEPTCDQGDVGAPVEEPTSTSIAGEVGCWSMLIDVEVELKAKVPLVLCDAPVEFDIMTVYLSM